MEEFVPGAALIAAVERKVGSAEEAEELLAGAGGRMRYVEMVPEKAEAILPVVARAGARAKLRMGGVTADAIPETAAVAGFMMACRRAGVAFKVTAGLHHAVRGVRRLTYEEESPRARMHGFLNVLLAAGLVFYGGSEKAVVKTLEEEDAAAFRLEEGGIGWHEHRMTAEQAAEVRGEFAMGFGSCSFTEPMEELKAMRWM
jgi:hypothetical protein